MAQNRYLCCTDLKIKTVCFAKETYMQRRALLKKEFRLRGFVISGK